MRTALVGCPRSMQGSVVALGSITKDCARNWWGILANDSLMIIVFIEVCCHSAVAYLLCRVACSLEG